MKPCEYFSITLRLGKKELSMANLVLKKIQKSLFILYKEFIKLCIIIKLDISILKMFEKQQVY